MTIHRAMLYAVIVLSLALGWWYAPTPVEVPQPLSGPGPIVTVEPDPGVAGLQVRPLGEGLYELRTGQRVSWVTLQA